MGVTSGNLGKGGVGVALVVTWGREEWVWLQSHGGTLYRPDVDIDVLVRNVRVIAEGLARHMYNLSIFVSHWM